MWSWLCFKGNAIHFDFSSDLDSCILIFIARNRKSTIVVREENIHMEHTHVKYIYEHIHVHRQTQIRVHRADRRRIAWRKLEGLILSFGSTTTLDRLFFAKFCFAFRDHCEFNRSREKLLFYVTCSAFSAVFLMGNLLFFLYTVLPCSRARNKQENAKKNIQNKTHCNKANKKKIKTKMSIPQKREQNILKERLHTYIDLQSETGSGNEWNEKRCFSFQKREQRKNKCEQPRRDESMMHGCRRISS